MGKRQAGGSLRRTALACQHSSSVLVLVLQRANIADFFGDFCVLFLENAKLKVFF